MPAEDQQLDRAEIVENVRRLSGVSADNGPDDAHIFAGVKGFVSAFDYWYIRVMREAVPQYRKLIIMRINPLIRRFEFEGLTAIETAQRLVEDYSRRNFVTAGGWALEELAVGASEDSQKSPAEGIDVQRYDVETGDYHLYVLKSGLVTRNSDIVKALKRNARQAEKLLRQGKGTGAIHANWAVLAGKTSSTFEDGVFRPSSAEFWSAMLGLPEEDAIELTLAMAAEAGRLVRRDASKHIEALVLLVADYIDDREAPGQVDWDFIATRTMRDKSTWNAEDQARHKKAMALLKAHGYEPE